MNDYPYHPLADIFPKLSDSEYAALVADIGKNGLRHPIILFDGAVLDGRHRHMACLDAGVEPRFEDYTGDDPASVVVSENITRRHLTESQRAYAAGKLANLPAGRPSGNSASLHGFSLQQAADAMNVSRRSAATGKGVAEKASAKVDAAVASGKVTVSDAAKVVSLPKADQNELADAVASGKAKTLASAARAAQVSKEDADYEAALARWGEKNRDFSNAMSRITDFHTATDFNLDPAEVVTRAQKEYMHDGAKVSAMCGELITYLTNFKEALDAKLR